MSKAPGCQSQELLFFLGSKTEPDSQNNGKLRSAALKRFHKRMKAIRLDVLEGNIPAENLYRGFGFQYMATLEMCYEDTGWINFKLYEYVIPDTSPCESAFSSPKPCQSVQVKPADI